MALDFLIGILLVISAIVNILALGAFWITPSLRTTSNRFVINLLTANLISCIILSPSFLINATSSTNKNLNSLYSKTEEIHEIVNKTNTNYQLEIHKEIESNLIKNESDDNVVTKIEINKKIIDEIEIDRHKNEEEDAEKITQTFEEIRSWGLDLAAALGSLSVLLVVGDTWCAVTDPLRYHSRISSLRAWILIITIWIIGIIFGLGSAFRKKRTITEFIQNKFVENYETADSIKILNETIKHSFTNDFTLAENIYTTFYSYIYFIVIILLPFGLVCGMYWRIFIEARGNGLRMRQNGSSPLLQSALNLAATSATQQNFTNINNNNNNNNNNHNQQQNEKQQHNTPTHYSGLTLKIDKPHYSSSLFHYHNNNNNNNIETSPLKKPLLLSTPIKINARCYQLELPKVASDRNQNIVLTVTTDTPTIGRSTSSLEKIRRNHSARQLFLLESTTEVSKNNDIRHVHSTPNLQKLVQTDNHHTSNTIPLSSNLQVPPKALSYMTSIRHRLSNASSLFKYREESRAARISILVVIMFLVSYLPYGVLVLLSGHIDFISPYQQAIFALLTVLLANISSPFIFAYRNKRVCRGVKRLLRLEKKSNQERYFQRQQGTYKTTVAKVKRNCSKASTYSQNTNRYLTPHNALKGTFVLEIEKCTDDEDSTYEEKKSFLKRICDTSRKWDCTTDSCSGGTKENEQTEV